MLLEEIMRSSVVVPQLAEITPEHHLLEMLCFYPHACIIFIFYKLPFAGSLSGIIVYSDNNLLLCSAKDSVRIFGAKLQKGTRNSYKLPFRKYK